MALWNTLHIFGFGMVQVITDTQNKQAPYDAVKAYADKVVDNVWAGRPEGYQGNKTYHAINNFNNLFSDWLPNEMNVQGFRVQAANLNHSDLDALAQAVLDYVEPTTTSTTTTTTTQQP